MQIKIVACRVQSFLRPTLITALLGGPSCCSFLASVAFAAAATVAAAFAVVASAAFVAAAAVAS